MQGALQWDGVAPCEIPGLEVGHGAAARRGTSSCNMSHELQLGLITFRQRKVTIHRDAVTLKTSDSGQRRLGEAL